MNNSSCSLVEVPKGSLLGFKAAPGLSATGLMAGKGTADAWSGVYVQLSISSAVRYLPNQYDRGEMTPCVLSVRAKRPLRIVVCRDDRMAATEISSAEKADIVRRLVSGLIDLKPALPLLASLGDADVALCLLDCEDYELAVPHCVFSEQNLDTSILLQFPQSERIPRTIGQVICMDDDLNVAVNRVLPKLVSSGRMWDAEFVGATLQKEFEQSGLPTKAQCMGDMQAHS